MDALPLTVASDTVRAAASASSTLCAFVDGMANERERPCAVTRREPMVVAGLLAAAGAGGTTELPPVPPPVDALGCVGTAVADERADDDPEDSGCEDRIDSELGGCGLSDSGPLTAGMTLRRMLPWCGGVMGTEVDDGE